MFDVTSSSGQLSNLFYHLLKSHNSPKWDLNDVGGSLISTWHKRQCVGKSGQFALLCCATLSTEIIAHLFLTGMMSFSLANWENRWQSDFHICCCIDWLTDWLPGPADLTAKHLRDRGLADLARCLNSVERGVCEPDCCSCFLLFLRSRWRGNILMSGGERLKEEAWCNRRKTRRRAKWERRESKRKKVNNVNKTHHSPWAPSRCVCMCV